MTTRQPLVAGNWKMNGSQALLGEIAAALVSYQGAAEAVVCPPFPYLAAARAALPAGVKVGGQNLSDQADGAFTGEVAGAMLAEVGCQYVIIGHSERRAIYGEGDALVAAKFAQAQAAGLVPILCVGETLEEREAGNTESVVCGQLLAVVDAVGIDAFASAVVAYEPVWAIGTGKTASPEQAQEVHATLRQTLAEKSPEIASSTRLLYGGSVKADNAALLFSQSDIDGGLIGGASLTADSFIAICQAAQ
ncbi:triose-phosphate isomerase [Alcanivorax sp. S6407]|uniref:triose-phosphate isomerase n=1 Tax=Alcanivorax sp. S6407 TaxID=2926424 RepID=UPI001FF41424|nr:triose-phosphate isomerase [Alcanivorax sp. S6407]MCK0155358.1 triose-phosphate isomerase [Alcanivorax sp. S6407]